MVRRYEEPIEVRCESPGFSGGLAGPVPAGRVPAAAHPELSGPPAGEVPAGEVPDEVPAAFIWRGRLYVVREVLGHWRERRAWWRDALDPTSSHVAMSSHVPAPSHAPARNLVAASTHGDTTTSLELEQEVWRVAASAGRTHATGVYDLGHLHQWRLLKVAD